MPSQPSRSAAAACSPALAAMAADRVQNSIIDPLAPPAGRQVFQRQQNRIGVLAQRWGGTDAGQRSTTEPDGRAGNRHGAVVGELYRLERLIVLNLLVGQHLGVTTPLPRENPEPLQLAHPLAARPLLQLRVDPLSQPLPIARPPPPLAN